MEQDNNIQKNYVAFGSNYAPYVEVNKVSSEEVEIRGKNWIGWGTNNDYPVYLYTLFNEVATLRTLINSVCDYVCGDGVDSGNDVLMPEIKITELVYDIALSYAVYGGFALQVNRNVFGQVCELIVLDMRYLRTDKKHKFFWYSEDFGKHSYGRCKAVCYPVYDKKNPTETSVYFYKNEKFNTYPQPVHVAAISACEIERKINDYHLNSLCNGFVGSVLVNMNNGTPEPTEQDKIVKGFNEKFTGSENAGRVVVTFNDGKERAAEILKLETEDYGEKYKTLIERSQSQIYSSWRCTPNLVGVPTYTTGFNSQEFSEAFKLFQRTMISPIQKQIVTVVNDLFEGQLNVVIDPFTIDFDANTTDDTKNIEAE